MLKMSADGQPYKLVVEMEAAHCQTPWLSADGRRVKVALENRKSTLNAAERKQSPCGPEVVAGIQRDGLTVQ